MNDYFMTAVTEIGTALIPGPGRIKGAVMGQDVESDHFQLMENINQNMEDFIVELFTESGSKVGKSCFTGDIVGNAGVGSVMLSAAVTEDFEKGAHILIAVDVSEQIEKKKAGRVITGRTFVGVAVGDNGTDKGKIYQ